MPVSGRELSHKWSDFDCRRESDVYQSPDDHLGAGLADSSARTGGPLRAAEAPKLHREVYFGRPLARTSVRVSEVRNLRVSSLVYRTLEFARLLSARHICQIINRWACFVGINRSKQTLSPHDLKRTAVTRALSLGFTYRQVQSMTGHKDIRMVVRYDHERGNLEENAINFLHYEEKKEN